MKKQLFRSSTFRWPCNLIIAIGLLFSSCEMSPQLEADPSSPVTSLEEAAPASELPSTPLFLASTVVLQEFSIYLDKGSATTGKLTVEIRTPEGNLLSSVDKPANDIITGRAWNTIVLPEPLSFDRGKKYRIHLIRSDEHDYPTGNYIFWRSSGGGVDSYPGGTNNVYPSWTLDYAFIIYTDGGISEQQTSTGYGFAIFNMRSAWQEVVADHPKVNLDKVALYIDKGVNTTGTVTVEIRNADGTDTLATCVRPVSTMDDRMSWVDFDLKPLLYRDQTYRIYMIRSGEHDYDGRNYIFWRSGPRAYDVYPDGVSNWYPSLNLDYSFRTYTDDGLDQEQLSTVYGFAIFNTRYYWQEFVPRNSY